MRILESQFPQTEENFRFVGLYCIVRINTCDETWYLYECFLSKFEVAAAHTQTFFLVDSVLWINTVISSSVFCYLYYPQENPQWLSYQRSWPLQVKLSSCPATSPQVETSQQWNGLRRVHFQILPSCTEMGVKPLRWRIQCFGTEQTSSGTNFTTETCQWWYPTCR